MKKCPYCAEEVQDSAVKCKHCHSDLSSQNGTRIEQGASSASHSNGFIETFTSIFQMPVLRVMLWILYFMIFVSMLTSSPFMSLIFLLPPVWWISTSKDKAKIKARLKEWKNHKTRVGFTVFFVLFSVFASLANADAERRETMIAEYPVPAIEIMSNTGSQGEITEYVLEFVSSDTTSVTVNGKTISPDENGTYQTTITLTKPSTSITIKAENEYKDSTETLTITRDKTNAEIAEEEKLAAEAKAKADREAAEEAERQREEEAAQRAWEQSEAGQICARHSDWTDIECGYVADNKYWIGMKYDMLIEERGQPSSTNPSNYGYGTQWQWCWWYYTPSCFYDDDDDGFIDSYN